MAAISSPSVLYQVVEFHDGSVWILDKNIPKFDGILIGERIGTG